MNFMNENIRLLLEKGIAEEMRNRFIAVKRRNYFDPSAENH